MNQDLFLTINSWAGRNQLLDWFMIFSADWLGYLLILGVVICFYKDRQKYRDMFIVAVGSGFIARVIFTEAIRLFYNNPRPFMALENVTQLINHETTSSFPSGHAAFYFALATGVYLYNKKASLPAQVGYIYFGLAGLMGFARIFGGVHWPLDIIAGAGLGIGTALLAYKIKQKMPRRANSNH